MNKIQDVLDLDPKDNPTWPPGINRHIMIQTVKSDKSSGKTYIGKVLKILQNNVGVIIYLNKGLTCDDTDIANEVKQYIKTTADPTKFMIIVKTHGWRYVEDINIKDTNGEKLYDDVHSGEPTLSNRYYSKAVDDPNTNVPLSKLLESQDLDDFAFLSGVNKDTDCHNKMPTDLMINETTYTINIEDHIPSKVKAYRQDILDKLDHSKIQDILIVDQAMIMQFVECKNALKKEALKIIQYLEEALYLEGPNAEKNSEKLYDSCRFVYYNGYVHIFRTGIPLKEIITHELLNDTTDDPKLKILGPNEYGIPIRHNILKYILFQNEIQRSLNIDQKLLLEAELVLSQEYIIALTPEPRYQMWCVIHLIKLWYGDIDLQNNIRKIKMIVNQYRTRSDKKYNIQNGIRFSIGVYPRYGKESASIVLRKLMYYFSIYFQAIGWRNNPPSYFKIVNDLISYTNCDQSLKLYYRRIANENNQSNNVFSNNYTLMHNPGYNTDILEQYVPL